MTVKWAGVNITAHVQEDNMDIIDALGQGAGTGGGASGRAATATFYVDRTLGSMYNAIGAGTPTSTAKIVRQGEVTIADFTGTKVFAGYATKLTDLTKGTVLKTQVDCIDYYQHLDSIYVNEVYDGDTDIYMIKDLLNKYASFIDQSALPSFATYTFGPLRLRNISLQKALAKITDTTGFQIWVGTDKKIHYENPATGQLASFSLSNVPDFQHKFPRTIIKYEVDDNAIINRVYFFGGKKPSIDQTVDLSNQANGVNVIFILPYYPHVSSDGKYHLTLNHGADLVIGAVLGTGAANTFKSQGGLCDVLLDSDAKTLTFDVAPGAGVTVTLVYSYQLPMVVVVTNEASHRYFGAYYDAIISDETVFDTNQATQRCKVLLLEQAYGLTSIQVTCWKAGLRSGQILPLYDTVRNINNNYIIQKVETKPLGNGSFEYTVDLGAWNWNMVDVMKNAIFSATPQDDSTDEDTTTAFVEQAMENVKVGDATQKTLTNFGGYCAHSSALADGHDAFAGFCSITT